MAFSRERRAGRGARCRIASGSQRTPFDEFDAIEEESTEAYGHRHAAGQLADRADYVDDTQASLGCSLVLGREKPSDQRCLHKSSHPADKSDEFISSI